MCFVHIAHTVHEMFNIKYGLALELLCIIWYNEGKSIHFSLSIKVSLRDDYNGALAAPHTPL